VPGSSGGGSAGLVGVVGHLFSVSVARIYPAEAGFWVFNAFEARGWMCLETSAREDLAMWCCVQTTVVIPELVSDSVPNILPSLSPAVVI
jgi:hypothetical protein